VRIDLVDEEHENVPPVTLGERLSRHWWLIGVAALLAWFALLWFMFGDVL
jgi:hypothetical protein